jgi:hypothetical protein
MWRSGPSSDEKPDSVSVPLLIVTVPATCLSLRPEKVPLRSSDDEDDDDEDDEEESDDDGLEAASEADEQAVRAVSRAREAAARKSVFRMGCVS